MEVYVDEKWKLSKKGSRSGAVGEGRRPLFMGSAREREGRRTWRSLSSRCARLVKEQRARFYIMRRCVAMLICWRDYP